MITKKFELTDTQLLSCGILNSPIALIPAPGANKIINPISIIARVYYDPLAVGLPYTTNLQLSVSPGGAPMFQSSVDFLGLIASIECWQTFIKVLPGTDQDQFYPNQALYLSSNTGNPTGGDLKVDLYVTYEVIEVNAPGNIVNAE